MSGVVLPAYMGMGISVAQSGAWLRQTARVCSSLLRRQAGIDALQGSLAASEGIESQAANKRAQLLPLHIALEVTRAGW